MEVGGSIPSLSAKPVVAQMVERRSHIPGVGGSSPPHGTIYNKEHLISNNMEINTKSGFV